MRSALARKVVRYAAVGCLGAFALIGTACLPKGVTLQPTGSSNACPAGTWHLTAETVNATLDTVFGNATITASGSGLTLTITTGSTNTWSLKGNQSVHASGTNFNVTATANPSASGTETITGSKITFTLNTISGTVSAHGTAWGHAISASYQLSQIGQLQHLWGLSGTATFTCGAGGTLTLSLPDAHMHFNK